MVAHAKLVIAHSNEIEANSEVVHLVGHLLSPIPVRARSFDYPEEQLKKKK
jgi:hypothetical protein